MDTTNALAALALIKAKHDQAGELLTELETTLRVREEFDLPMTGKLTIQVHQVQRDTLHKGPGHGMKGMIQVTHEAKPDFRHVRNLKDLSPELATLIYNNFPKYAHP
jgi:hypothetical protein